MHIYIMLDVLYLYLFVFIFIFIYVSRILVIVTDLGCIVFDLKAQNVG